MPTNQPKKRITEQLVPSWMQFVSPHVLTWEDMTKLCPSPKERQQETPEAISLTTGLGKQWAPGIKEAEMKDYLA